MKSAADPTHLSADFPVSSVAEEGIATVYGLHSTLPRKLSYPEDRILAHPASVDSNSGDPQTRKTGKYGHRRP